MTEHTTDLRTRQARIGDLLAPCPPPDVAAGHDLCPCATGTSWPCPITRAAWLATGRDPAAEVRAAYTAAAQRILDEDEPGWSW
jgi:hypothetical protein